MNCILSILVSRQKSKSPLSYVLVFLKKSTKVTPS